MDHREGKNVVIVLRAHAIALAIAVVFGGLSPAGSAEMGRLFFTPQERQALNQKRLRAQASGAHKTDAKSDAELMADAEPIESVPLPPPKITGKVTRSSGNNTLWVNHYPQYKRGRP